MMIARGDIDGEPFLLLGLTLENVRRLQEGQPIRLHRRTHGEGIPDGWTIGIIYADNEGTLEQIVKPMMPFPNMTFRRPNL